MRAWASVLGGLLLLHLSRSLRQPVFVTPPRYGGSSHGYELDRYAAGTPGCPPPSPGEGDGSATFGLAGLGLSLATVGIGRSARGRRAHRQPGWPLRAAGKGGAGSDKSGGDGASGAGAGTPEATQQERVEDCEAAVAPLDELTSVQVDDEIRVLAANRELYAAFSAGDIERMKALWLDAGYVQCIHPYEERAVGHTAVCRTWQAIFDAAKSKGRSISPEDVRVVVRNSTAVVHCSERVEAKAQPTQMLATNVFGKVNDKWYLVHRHVSLAGEFSAGAPQLDKRPAYFDKPEALMMAWQVQRAAQAAQCFPNAKIVFGVSDSDDGSFDDEDEDYDSHVIGVSDMQGEGIDSVRDLDSEEDSEEDSDLEEMLAEERELECARDTVRALRRLGHEERLTTEERIRLTSEMLQSPGESLAERAHELLLVNLPDADEEEVQEAWSDFAALAKMEATRLLAQKVCAPAAGVPKRPPRSGNGKKR